jgi:hypothetical protein
VARPGLLWSGAPDAPRSRRKRWFIAVHEGQARPMSVLASASGVRIDCDRCRDHAFSPHLSLARLRRATGFVRANGRDFCPRCARSRAAATAL